MMLSHGGAGVVNATFCAGIPAAPGPQMASILEALRISVFICQDEPVHTVGGEDSSGADRVLVSAVARSS